MKILKYKNWIYASLAVLGALAVVFFVEIRQKNQKCTKITIQLDEQAEYPFFSEEQIMRLATTNDEIRILGTLSRKLDLADIEKRVESNRLIKNCQTSLDLSGNLVVVIEQQKPLARLIISAEDQEIDLSKGAYLTETAEIVPLSKEFAARVPLISGKFFGNLKQISTNTGKQLIELLRAIRQDSFWRAQVTELVVDQSGEVTMLTQVGDQMIDFGLPDDAVVKFEKLKLFYKNIVPLKGLDTYKRVSVKFKNQIVCE
jgi:cell division protein FtsQ